MNSTKIRNRIKEPLKHMVKDRVRLFCPIPDCPYEGATRLGYSTRQGYENHFIKYHLQSETVGLTSRWDWGSPAFRKGLIDRASAEFEAEEVRFVVLAGGLVSYPHLKNQITATSLTKLWEEKWGEDPQPGKKPSRKERVEKARNWLLNHWAEKIAQIFPRFKNKQGHWVKTYIITSPAPNYDGWIGREVAERLAKIRPDIRYKGEESARLTLKRQNMVIWILTPEKASWRSKYYSTSVDRLIEDKEKQTSHPLPDLWVVGCTASSLRRPQGERKRPYISVPALHRLEEIHTAENQVGVRVVEFFPQSSLFLARTYEYKNYTARERDWIPQPEEISPLQREILTTLKEAKYIGELEDALKVPRHKISTAIEELNASGYQPKILFDKTRQLYDLDPQWIQNKLTYPILPEEALQEDVLVAFGCLHAGCTFGEYYFFVNKVPELMLEQGTTILVGAGDFIEGLEHHLAERGEVMAGFDYTDQETFAAYLICEIMRKVFIARIDLALNNSKGKSRKISNEGLVEAVDEALLTFIYRPGNHDEWLEKKGIKPLKHFHTTLVDCLSYKLEEVLRERNLFLPNLRQIVEARVVRGETHQLPSGLELAILHPHMARAQTSSLRAQQMLAATQAQVVVGANFHVATIVEQWESDQKQRLAIQTGSLVWKTSFEHSKMKILDVGVCAARILSHKGRVIMTETVFFDEGVERREYKNEDLLWNFLANLGVSK